MSSMLTDLSTRLQDIKKLSKTIRIPIKEKIWILGFFASNTTVKRKNIPLCLKKIVLKMCLAIDNQK